jgi:hypothetical protein
VDLADDLAQSVFSINTPPALQRHLCWRRGDHIASIASELAASRV